MTILDKVIAAVLPAETDQERADARLRARAAAVTKGWLAMVLDHHLAIENAFEAVKSASGLAARRSAQKELAAILTGHSIAEEAVIYPAMALTSQKGRAEHAYVEQSEAKVQMAGLEELNPLSPEYLDRLEQLREAVAHHVYEEESSWFAELSEQASATTQDRLARRYKEEFDRYMASNYPWVLPAAPALPEA